MAKGWKLGGVYTYNGKKVVVSAINSDGTLTLNFAAGSGKTGFAGTISTGKKNSFEVNSGSFNVPEDEVEGEGISLDAYNASIRPALGIGDTIVTHDSGFEGIITRVDDKFITPEYLKKHFPDFNGEYVGYAVNYDTQSTGNSEGPLDDNRWTTVVELSEDGVTRRYVIKKDEDGNENPYEI